MRNAIFSIFLGTTFAMPMSYAQQGPCAQNSLCNPDKPCYIMNKSEMTIDIYDNGNPQGHVIMLSPRKHWCYNTTGYGATAYNIYWYSRWNADDHLLGQVPGAQCVTLSGNDANSYSASTNLCATTNKMKSSKPPYNQNLKRNKK